MTNDANANPSLTLAERIADTLVIQLFMLENGTWEMKDFSLKIKVFK